MADQGVDVGGVEEGEAAGQGVVGLQAEFGPLGPVALGVGRSWPSSSARERWRTDQMRVSPGSTLGSANHARSSGWQTSTGVRVVGRSTPEGLTRRPTSELTKVDFPAPVEPPMTARSGASGALSRGTR